MFAGYETYGVPKGSTVIFIVAPKFFNLDATVKITFDPVGTP